MQYIIDKLATQDTDPPVIRKLSKTCIQPNFKFKVSNFLKHNRYKQINPQQNIVHVQCISKSDTGAVPGGGGGPKLQKFNPFPLHIQPDVSRFYLF